MNEPKTSLFEACSTPTYTCLKGTVKQLLPHTDIFLIQAVFAE